jgi:glycosyltransferase involved in cell wall biosynthesis
LKNFLCFLDAFFFRRIAVAAIGCSPECGRQVRKLAGFAFPFYEYRSQFRLEGFDPSYRRQNRDPFQVAFAGRIELEKGVLDILRIADRLRATSDCQVIFHICGTGSALPELRRKTKELRLHDVISVHGPLHRAELLQIYRRSHAVIVPTRRTFSEGLPLVCAEAILSGLPLVTSVLTNALPVLGDAILEAEPENIESYTMAILKLMTDEGTYDRLSHACPKLARQFLDRSQSYPAAVDRLVKHVFPNWNLLEDYGPLFARLDEGAL